ncbi:hypothetical protein AB0D91_05310 [Streptomyces canus]|uniref:hypothetical protein n=1 Tax=Streptomyces canus TaxID=58343 RepID=UPI0033DAA008
MPKRRAKKADPNDELELGLTFDVISGLPMTTVQPRTTPIPDKPRRRSKKTR